MRAWGSRYARLVLERCGGRKRHAARTLGISYHTLNSYLRFPLSQPSAATDAVDLADAMDTIDEVDAGTEVHPGIVGSHEGDEAEVEVEERVARMAT